MQGEQAELPRPDEARAPASRAFPLVFALCSGVALGVLWIPKYLPMADLPQHAAQISIWKHLNDPAYGFTDVFELHYFTPYLFGYGLSRLFAGLVSILVALKLVLSLAVLGLPLSLWCLLNATRGDRWWSLLGFPIAFGYPFLWGFFNYIVAIPLGVLYLAFVVDYARSFSPRRAVLLAAYTGGLFVAHLLIFALCGLSAAALIGFSAKTWRAALIRLTPLAMGLLVALAWAATQTPSRATVVNVPAYGFSRLLEAPALLVAYPSDPAGLAVGVLLLLLFVVSGVRLAGPRARWIPLGLWAGAYLLLPRDFGNVGFVSTRLATLLVPFALLATDRGHPRIRPLLTRLALSVLVLGWLFVVFTSFYGFDRDARQFEAVMAQMESNKRIRSLVFDRGEEYTPGGAPFLHFPVWYQVEKGGTTSFSFASSSLSVAVFRPGTRRSTRPSIDWHPAAFDMRREQDDYDYYVVRAPISLAAVLFRGATRRISLVAHEGMWWVYRPGEPLPVVVP